MQHEAKHCRIEMRAQIINDEHGGSGTKGGNDQEPKEKIKKLKNTNF